MCTCTATAATAVFLDNLQQVRGEDAVGVIIVQTLIQQIVRTTTAGTTCWKEKNTQITVK